MVVTGITVRDSADGLRFAVRVQPRAARSEIVGVHGGALKVRVTAPPVEGAANEAVVALLAGALGIAKARVRIVGGASGRLKTVEVDGIDRRHLHQLTLVSSNPR
jgi:uncharacterized protein (TIGR00251 family)